MKPKFLTLPVWVAGCLFLFLPCPAVGQVGLKAALTEGDYKSWSTLHVEQLSPKGSWCSFVVQYEGIADTLFVKQTSGRKSHAYPNTIEGDFVDEECFASISADSILTVTDLRSGKRQAFAGVSRYERVGGKRIAFQYGRDKLQLRDQGGAVVYSADGVTNWQVSPTGTHIAFVTRGAAYQVCLLDVATLGVDVLLTDTKPIGNVMVWNASGSVLAFTDSGNAVHSYALNSESHHSFQGGAAINGTIDGSGLLVSNDGKRIFFYVNPETKKTIDDDPVQVWNASDKRLYPRRARIPDWSLLPKLGCWLPEQDTFSFITDGELPYVALNGTQEYALIWDAIANEPQDKKDADIDVYQVDLGTGERKLLLENQAGNQQQMLTSAEGRFVAYFRENDWHLYDFKTEKHLNLTGPARIKASSKAFGVLDDTGPIETVYFSKGEKYVVVMDEFDLWRVATDGSGATRLTFGRERNIRYRIADYKKISGRYSGIVARQVDLEKPLLVSVVDRETYRSGFALVGPGRKEQTLLFSDARVAQPLRSEDGGVIVCTRERYNAPPSLIVLSPGKPVKSIYQSNPQHSRFAWGNVEMIGYVTKTGKSLKGLLYYPPGFEKGKHYPMVVHVYEKQSQHLHEYINPSLYEPNGFNVTNFTSKGYVVFLPDTEAELAFTGRAATECITAAVQKIIDIGVADPKRIGLIGHSHGGFKASFIVTQTDMFAAVIASAGLTNLASDYLTMSDIDTPNYWRYEHHQQRMGKSLFEDPEAYLRNSAVFQAPNVTTPLLTWSGNSDRHVDYRQTMQLYFALRRLGKEHVMLLYPKEGHVLSDPKHQEDLQRRVFGWFGHYLKGEPKAGWMQPQR